MFENADAKLLINLLEGLPYPAQLYAPNGDLLMANSAFLKQFSISDPEELTAKYNLINDPTVKDAPFYDNIIRAFDGAATQSQDVIIPIHHVKTSNNLPASEIETLIADVTSVPIFENGGMIYVANFLIIKRHLCSRREIDIAKAYIETHWLEKFDFDEVARITCLSSSHLAHLFKAYTGMTLHDYYTDIKIEKIKDKLLDMNLSVDEAFSECGVDYHGYYAGLFKKKTGFSPSEYRKLALR